MLTYINPLQELTNQYWTVDVISFGYLTESSVGPDDLNVFKNCHAMCLKTDSFSINVRVPWEEDATSLVSGFFRSNGKIHIHHLQIRIKAQKACFYCFSCTCLPPKCMLQWNYGQLRKFTAVIHWLLRCLTMFSSPVPQWCSKINPKAKPLVLVLQLDQSERRIWLSGSFLASVF